jgi:FKBP-type peptidyl-prolyl cis-trans isomerase FkpA
MNRDAVSLRYDMWMRVTSFLTLVLCLTAAGCGGDDNPTGPAANVPYSATDLKVGTGTEATNGRTVTVNYTGWLYSTTAADNKGTQFDSSLNPGRTPFTFTVGVSNVISGWHQGVPGMRVGGTRRLVLPPSLAYGSQGNPPAIPGNATLIFDIELLAVQ